MRDKTRRRAGVSGWRFQTAVSSCAAPCSHNLDLALRLREVCRRRTGRPGSTRRRESVGWRICSTGRPGSLSGGEAQRVNLARALALRAPVTLLDEPLAGIDRIARTQLLADLPRLLATFATTTIMVTHDREEAFRLADRLVVVIGGEVKAAGAKGSVYAHPPDRETAELLGYTVLPTAAGLVAITPGGLQAREWHAHVHARGRAGHRYGESPARGRHDP